MQAVLRSPRCQRLLLLFLRSLVRLNQESILLKSFHLLSLLLHLVLLLQQAILGLPWLLVRPLKRDQLHLAASSLVASSLPAFEFRHEKKLVQPFQMVTAHQSSVAEFPSPEFPFEEPQQKKAIPPALLLGSREPMGPKKTDQLRESLAEQLRFDRMDFLERLKQRRKTNKPTLQ